MRHAPGRTGGALPDRLYPGHKQLPVTERSYLRRKVQNGPLPGLGVPPRSRACRAFALPREVYTLPHQASGNPRKGRPHVFRAPAGHPQATLAGTPPSGLDIT